MCVFFSPNKIIYYIKFTFFSPKWFIIMNFIFFSQQLGQMYRRVRSLKTPRADKNNNNTKTNMATNNKRPLGCLNTQPFEMQYALGTRLGEGGFGKVYSATRISDGIEVAVKQVSRGRVPTWGAVSIEWKLKRNEMKKKNTIII